MTSAGVSLTAQWIERTSGKARSASISAVGALEVARGGDEHDQRLAGVPALADDQMTEIALLALLVEGRQALGPRPGLHRLADPVAEVGRQPAALDVEHLVPAARAVEAEAERAVLERRERVLELVAIVEDGRGRDRGLELDLEPPDARERVGDLVSLGVELRLVGEVLEATAPALGVVLTGRLDARCPGLDDGDRDRLRVALLHLRHPRAHDVSRKRAIHEDDEPVQAGDAAPAVGERVDAEIDLLVLLDGDGHPARVAGLGGFGGMVLVVGVRWSFRGKDAGSVRIE